MQRGLQSVEINIFLSQISVGQQTNVEQVKTETVMRVGGHSSNYAPSVFYLWS